MHLNYFTGAQKLGFISDRQGLVLVNGPNAVEAHRDMWR